MTTPSWFHSFNMRQPKGPVLTILGVLVLLCTLVLLWKWGSNSNNSNSSSSWTNSRSVPQALLVDCWPTDGTRLATSDAEQRIANELWVANPSFKTELTEVLRCYNDRMTPLMMPSTSTAEEHLEGRHAGHIDRNYNFGRAIWCLVRYGQDIHRVLDVFPSSGGAALLMAHALKSRSHFNPAVDIVTGAELDPVVYHHAVSLASSHCMPFIPANANVHAFLPETCQVQPHWDIIIFDEVGGVTTSEEVGSAVHSWCNPRFVVLHNLQSTAYRSQVDLDAHLAASPEWTLVLGDSQVFPHPPNQWSGQRQWRIYAKVDKL